MLAVSIPKVATLFHAYDTETFGLVWGGLDIRSWAVGIAVDLTATFTTWAAMHKYEESRSRWGLFAPGFIILVCTGLSVVANYEDAATLAPEQYSAISLFTQPALLVNPMLISAPPVLVFLLIILVPSVLAQPRIKGAAEIAAETEEQEALIAAHARVREAKVRANARVRSAQVSGLADTMGVVAKRAGFGQSAQSNDSGPRTGMDSDRVPEDVESVPVITPGAHISRAMWNTMSLKDRVLKSGIISAQEVAEVLGVSLTRARELVKGVRAPDHEKRAVPGRSGVSYTALVDTLYERRTKESFAQAQKLVTALGLRRRARSLQVVPDDAMSEEPTEEDAS
jgi:hypothetical protein